VGLGRILEQQKASFDAEGTNSSNVRALPIEMHGHDRARMLAEDLRHRIDRYIEGVRTYVGEAQP